MKFLFKSLPFLLLFSILAVAQTYPNNEDGQYQDMLTPEYYNSAQASDFRLELNKFVHFARQIPFQHPFKDSLGSIPAYNINRGFGDIIGTAAFGTHHPAYDYYPAENATNTYLYAAHDGLISTDNDADRYRHYIAITKDVSDSLGHVIGKIMTLYGHVDLDLDLADGLDLEGQYVQKGDIISKHLYSGTMGGPHLHFEIRYYRPSDTGSEDFYGGQVGDKTSPSSGIWTKGYWNPSEGYGFAHPLNHLNYISSAIAQTQSHPAISIFPNPSNHLLKIKLDQAIGSKLVTIYNLAGRKVYQNNYSQNSEIQININNLAKGIYLVNIYNNGQKFTHKFFK